MKLLRLKIFQPNAFYKIPYAPSRNLTYPIPPFSTVIGFICNILGIKSQNDYLFHKIRNDLYLSVYGDFKSITKEMIWLRTLDRGKHIQRFRIHNSRIYNGQVEHPGGQVPSSFHILENAKLIIYILSSEEVLNCIYNSILHEYKSNSILHLGRAEDLILFDGNSNEAVKIIEISENKKPLYENIDYYTWIPDPILSKESGDNTFYQNTFKFYDENFDKVYQMIDGTINWISCFYKIQRNVRVFRYIPVKLFEKGSIPFYMGKPINFIFDEELNLPLFLCYIPDFER